MNKDWKRELFLNRNFEANSLKVHGIILGSSIEDIDYFDIVDIYVDKKDSEKLNFKGRIEILKRSAGWVHLASGASFEIKKGIIKQIKLSARYLQDEKMKRSDFLKIFGQPDEELVDDICYSGLDYSIDANILIYRKKKLYAFLDPKTERLKELHFGEFNENLYNKK